ncbi:hypothetical protein KIN20_005244 [Parelaphostrongylus tenuis]|uniref:Uncharacterized protein n=1 Tax=Parelaphostrongylus tenuis TaxID=148309 RepID=A0AAD5QFS1_PARTN|nr:hypothetical protein KIN20_005244 [Parelaphostrongylus tenuis]
MDNGHVLINTQKKSAETRYETPTSHILAVFVTKLRAHVSRLPFPLSLDRSCHPYAVNSPSAVLNSLFNMSQLAGNTNPAAFSFLEQFNHMNSVQEQLNSTAPV